MSKTPAPIAFALLATLSLATAPPAAAAPPLLPPHGGPVAPPAVSLPATEGTASAGRVRPPSAEEQKLFADGLRLFQAGDARGAEQAWKAGYAVGRDPAFLVRIGEAQEKAGDPSQAAQTYEQYLRESPAASDREDILGRVARLNPRPASASGAAAAEGELPGEMRGAPGAETPPVPAPPPAAPGAPLPPTVAQERDDAMQDLMPLIQDEAPRSTLNTTAWAGVGVTALLLGVAGFYAASARDKADDANRLLTYRDTKTGVPQEYATRAVQYEAAVRDGQHDDRVAKGVAIAAGISAIAAAVLFIIDGRAPRAAGTRQARAGGWSAGAC